MVAASVPPDFYRTVGSKSPCYKEHGSSWNYTCSFVLQSLLFSLTLATISFWYLNFSQKLEKISVLLGFWPLERLPVRCCQDRTCQGGSRMGLPHRLGIPGLLGIRKLFLVLMCCNCIDSLLCGWHILLSSDSASKLSRALQNYLEERLCHYFMVNEI